MAKYTGFVARVGHKEGNGRNGPWHLYSLKLEKEDGQEYKDWISLGFRDEPPKIKEGDYITLEANPDDQGRLVFVEGTATKPKNPPARAQRSQQAGSGSGGGNRGGYSGPRRGGGGGGYQPRVRDGSGVNDRTNPEDAKRMTYADSRKSAIHVISLLLEHKALPITGAQGKAGEAKRFSEIQAAIDKLTVEYFNDSMTLRKLATVADGGAVSVAPDGELPKEQVQHAIDDDTPPSDDGSVEGSDEQEDQGDDDVI